MASGRGVGLNVVSGLLMADLHCSNSGRNVFLKTSLLPVSNSCASVSADTFFRDASRKHEQNLLARSGVTLVRSPRRLTQVSFNSAGLTGRLQPAMPAMAKKSAKGKIRTYLSSLNDECVGFNSGIKPQPTAGST